MPFSGQRLCTRSIHRPPRSASATRFASFASHSVSKRRETQSGSRTERENLDGDAKGKGASGSNREAESTDAPARGGLLRSSDEIGRASCRGRGETSALAV